MSHRVGRNLSRASIVMALSACLLALLVQDACVLAAPSGDLVHLPDSRPTIVHASLVPSTSRVITSVASFIVPVELADPTVAFVYSTFIDYNPMTGEGLVDAPSRVEPTNEPGRIRIVTFSIPMLADPERCHTIEIVVALALDQATGHTPDDRGGDVATWFYNPNGDLGGCPSLEAGVDAARPDSDSGEGGVQ